MTHCSAYAVHRSVTAAQHHHRLFLEVDVLLGLTGIVHFFIHIGDQVIERLINTRQILAGEVALHCLVGAHTQEDGIVVSQQLVNGDVTAHFSVQPELDAHAFKDLATTLHYLLLELELRNTKGQKTTDFGITVKDRGLHAVARQDVSTAQTCRPCADDRDLLFGGHYIREIRAPAHGQRGVGNVLLGVADSHGTESIVQSARPLTEAILGANATTDLGQRIGLMTELCRLKQVALSQQLEPVGNEVMYGALPFTIGVAALQTAVRLLSGLHLRIGIVDLYKSLGARLHVLFDGILAVDIQKLKRIGQSSTHVSCLSPYPANARANG